MAFMEWDAGMLPAAGTMIRTRVFYPNDPGLRALVGVIHGASANGSYHLELARTLASRGLVVVLPDMPCSVITGCDHDANQRQITALLAWAVAQSGDASSRLAGRVDGARRGLIGHSWGGLSSHLTAARDRTITSLVLLDPNDDRGVGLAATSTITAPTLQLLAQVPGGCNSAWDEATVRSRLPPPNLQMTVSRSGHCDAGEVDLLCSIACNPGDRATVPLFRRYAVAWTMCVLDRDPTMAPWLGGASMSADASGGRIQGVLPTALGTLPCRVAAGDAGMPGTDAGDAPGSDAVAADDGVAADVTTVDAAATVDVNDVTAVDDVVPQLDAGDASVGDTGTGSRSRGCGCVVAGARSAIRFNGALFASVALAALRRGRRRRRAIHPER